MMPGITAKSDTQLRPTLPAALLALALAACGDSPPPPKPVTLTAPAQPTPAPEAKPAPAQKPADDPQAAADQALAASVKSALLAEKALNAHRIDVVAKRGVVTLFGTTETYARRSMAEKIAAGVGGVVLVENKLAVVAGS